ncbi:Hypothetical protein BCD_0406 [Borrelia crocidurae DOU]|uniref:Uncharacterized protein n=1 Tax=Borrelia crocidurae DOU TaxID=1293575 RepID=W5SHU0_9SPIR|nr:hypothetical protein [Borrelia crocidurae]AHH06472.1 Hypothetical protein BCD_0406 [Borrelia crocidurae DOU]
MKKIIYCCLLLSCINLYSLNNEIKNKENKISNEKIQKKDEINKKNLPLKEKAEKNKNSIFSINRGFIYSTGIGLGTGFFLNAENNHIIFRPYYTFATNNLDFMAVCMILMIEDYNVSKKIQFSSTYIGIGINWNIINFFQKLKYLSTSMGIGGRFYLSTNLIGNFRFYNKIPYVVEPYIFFEFSTKESISYLNIYSKVECLFLDTFHISFNFGIRYNLKNKKGENQ